MQTDVLNYWIYLNLYRQYDKLLVLRIILLVIAFGIFPYNKYLERSIYRPYLMVPSGSS